MHGIVSCYSGRKMLIGGMSRTINAVIAAELGEAAAITR